MATTAIYRTRALIEGAIDREPQAMVCVHGDVGLGKTFAVHNVLRTIAPDAVAVLELPPGADKDVLHSALWRCLDLPGGPPKSTDACTQQLREALATELRILLVDEVQLVSTYALEYLRFLWERRETRLAIVFVGSGNARQRVLHAKPVHSRIHDWQLFNPLTPDEVLDTISAYHPVWADRDPELLLWTDDYGGHGNFRNWAHATLFLHERMQADPDLPLSKDLIRWAFSHLDSTSRYPGRS